MLLVDSHDDRGMLFEIRGLIGVAHAIADECVVYSWQAVASCGRCPVNASGTRWLVANGSSLLCVAHAEPDARANHRECMMNGTDVARRVDAGSVRRTDVLCEG